MTKIEVDLFRAVRIEQFPDGTIIDGLPALGVLYPQFEPRALPNGGRHEPDIQSSVGPDGAMWVRSKGGTSLFDREKVFPGNKWLSFAITAGTIVPEGLIIRRTDFNKKYQANHYQIESLAGMMRMDAYMGALDNLARNAIVRAVAVAKSQQNKS